MEGGESLRPLSTTSGLFIALPAGWTLNFCAVSLSEIYKSQRERGILFDVMLVDNMEV